MPTCRDVRKSNIGSQRRGARSTRDSPYGRTTIVDNCIVMASDSTPIHDKAAAAFQALFFLQDERVTTNKIILIEFRRPTDTCLNGVVVSSMSLP